ncbi:MAG: Molybdate-binding protein ModA [Saezia sanguinis]
MFVRILRYDSIDVSILIMGDSMRSKFTRLIAAVLLLCSTHLVFAQELIVSAAASLSNAFKDVGEAFEKQNPGVKVTFNFAASGVLLRQIEQGAPVDVFASADQATMDRAKDLIADSTRFDFARNTLVLIVPAGATQQPAKLEDLKESAYRTIAVGTPSSVPAGNYTQQVMQKEQLWSVLEPKFVFGENVRQVLQYVSRKEADAGFVYGTDAALSANEVTVALVVPTESAITYPMAQIKASDKPELAGKFMQFVVSEDGQKILARYGFVSP